jgi:hypothetical protein
MDDRTAELEQQLEMARLRGEVAISLAPHIFAYLDHEPEPTSIVVDDVVDRWRQRGNGEPEKLTGPGGFVDAYLAQVEWEHGEGGDERFRAEFCPPGVELPGDEYFIWVWTAHVKRLRERR